MSDGCGCYNGSTSSRKDREVTFEQGIGPLPKTRDFAIAKFKAETHAVWLAEKGKQD